ncbi:hypothetical protein HDU96_009809 [Phlyctochytrium bullatum]|nr:hypothetical protein HDU96_009809 [Phlyctochytrium bullatum]
MVRYRHDDDDDSRGSPTIPAGRESGWMRRAIAWASWAGVTVPVTAVDALASVVGMGCYVGWLAISWEALQDRRLWIPTDSFTTRCILALPRRPASLPTALLAHLDNDPCLEPLLHATSSPILHRLRSLLLDPELAHASCDCVRGWAYWIAVGGSAAWAGRLALGKAAARFAVSEAVRRTVLRGNGSQVGRGRGRKGVMRWVMERPEVLVLPISILAVGYLNVVLPSAAVQGFVGFVHAWLFFWIYFAVTAIVKSWYLRARGTAIPTDRIRTLRPSPEKRRLGRVDNPFGHPNPSTSLSPPRGRLGFPHRPDPTTALHATTAPAAENAHHAVPDPADLFSSFSLRDDAPNDDDDHNTLRHRGTFASLDDEDEDEDTMVDWQRGAAGKSGPAWRNSGTPGLSTRSSSFSSWQPSVPASRGTGGMFGKGLFAQSAGRETAGFGGRSGSLEPQRPALSKSASWSLGESERRERRESPDVGGKRKELVLAPPRFVAPSDLTGLEDLFERSLHVAGDTDSQNAHSHSRKVLNTLASVFSWPTPPFLLAIFLLRVAALWLLLIDPNSTNFSTPPPHLDWKRILLHDGLAALHDALPWLRFVAVGAAVRLESVVFHTLLAAWFVAAFREITKVTGTDAGKGEGWLAWVGASVPSPRGRRKVNRTFGCPVGRAEELEEEERRWKEAWKVARLGQMALLSLVTIRTFSIIAVIAFRQHQPASPAAGSTLSRLGFFFDASLLGPTFTDGMSIPILTLVRSVIAVLDALALLACSKAVPPRSEMGVEHRRGTEGGGKMRSQSPFGATAEASPALRSGLLRARSGLGRMGSFEF